MAEEVKDTAAADAEAKAAVDAAAAKAAAEIVVPESYAFAMPEGTLLDEKVTERITERAKSLKVTDPTFAQAMLEVAHTEVQATIAAYEAAHKEGGVAFKMQEEANEKESLAHPDLGRGNKAVLEQKAVNAGLVLKQFAPELAPVLKAAGLANKAETLIALNRIHAAMQESKLATGAPASKVLTGHKALFPDGIPDDVGASTARP